MPTSTDKSKKNPDNRQITKELLYLSGIIISNNNSTHPVYTTRRDFSTQDSNLYPTYYFVRSFLVKLLELL